MTRDESTDEIVHDALKACGYKCQGVLSVNLLYRTKKFCPERHLEFGINYKGRVILQPFFSKKEVTMLCWKCLQKAAGAKKARKTKGPEPD